MISLNGIKLEKNLGMASAILTTLLLSLKHPKNETKDKVWSDDYCEENRVKATTALRRINTIIRHMMKEDKFKQYDCQYPLS